MAFSLKLDFSKVGLFDPTATGFGIAPYLPVVATIKQANVSSDTAIAVTLEYEGQTTIAYLDTARRDTKEMTPVIQNRLVDFAWASGAGENALDATIGMYSYYDKDLKGMSERQGEIFPALAGKQIGVIMTTDYWLDKTTGAVASAVRPYQWFKADTNQLPTDFQKGIAGSVESLAQLAETARLDAEKKFDAISKQASALASVTPTFGASAGADTNKAKDEDVPF